jgi:hypothetical protein
MNLVARRVIGTSGAVLRPHFVFVKRFRRQNADHFGMTESLRALVDIAAFASLFSVSAHKKSNFQSFLIIVSAGIPKNYSAFPKVWHPHGK